MMDTSYLRMGFELKNKPEFSKYRNRAFEFLYSRSSQTMKHDFFYLLDESFDFLKAS
jgi:hypothetical protein